MTTTTSTENKTTTTDKICRMAPASSRPDRSRFNFEHRWFDQVLPEWDKRTSSLQGTKLRILEIGSFEGGSATWILDNLMSHPESTLTTVDTFGGSMEHADHPSEEYNVDTLEKRFRANVALCSEHAKLTVIKARSEEALLELRRQGKQYDFIYIDASHVAFDVLHDGAVAWRMLVDGGTMVFDDYTWQRYNEDAYNPGIAVDALVACAAPWAVAEAAETQMWVKKVACRIEPTVNADPELAYWGTDAWKANKTE